MQKDSLIINTAITGLVHSRLNNSSLPVTPDEIAEDCYQCYQAGASIFHLHASDENGKPTYRSDIYREIISKVRGKCPDVIICVSTSGRIFNSFENRSEVLEIDGDLKPDMASLTLGSLNFPSQASVNEPKMITMLVEKMYERGIVPELEVFDLGMVDYAKYLINKKILREPFYFNLFLGSLGTLSASPLNLAILMDSLPANSVWAGAGIGRYQFFVNAMAITMGGHVRVGLEDNLYMDVDKKIPATNLKLVERLVQLSITAGRKIGNPKEARNNIGLS